MSLTLKDFILEHCYLLDCSKQVLLDEAPTTPNIYRDLIDRYVFEVQMPYLVRGKSYISKAALNHIEISIKGIEEFKDLKVLYDLIVKHFEFYEAD